MGKAWDRVARALEIVLSAPAYAAVCFLMTMLLRPWNSPGFLETYLISLFFASALPVIVIMACVRVGLVSDVFLSKREERGIPFVGAISSYLAGTWSLSLMRAPRELLALMSCYAFITTIMLLVSLSWKISIHAAGISGPTTCLVYLLGWKAIFLYTLLVPVCWSRLRLGQHDLKQVLAGSLLPIPASWFWMELAMKVLFTS